MIGFFIFLFGLIIGSFLNAALYRLEVGGSLVKERSRCPLCGHILKWYELLPVLSFLIQKRKCRSCGGKISFQYPLVELLTGFLFLSTFLYIWAGLSFQGIIDVVYIFTVLSFIILIFVFDLKHYIIPNIAVYSLITISFFYSLYFYSFSEILFYILAAFLASGFFLLLYVVSSGKWIGMGDVKYGVFMGFFLGWPKILIGLFIAYIVGALVGVMLMAFEKKNIKSEIPFGPFLIVGTLTAYFFGMDILSWYLNLAY